MHQIHCNHCYTTMWWSRYAAYINNFLAPHQVICRDANDLLLNYPVHLFVDGAAQFSHRLGSLLGPVATILSAHSAAASTQRSFRP